MGNPIHQTSEKSLRYLCTVISNEKVTDLTNSEECGVHSILGHIVFTRGSEDKNDSFSIPINSIDLYNDFGLLFTNISTRGSFVVLRPVFYNGFSNIVPDMVRVYVRTTAVDANFDKRGLQVLERMCAEQVFSESLSFLADQNKIVIETSEFLFKGKNGWSQQLKQKQLNVFPDQESTSAGKILVSQRTSAAQNKSEITTVRTHGSAKLSAEQRLNAEAMLNAIITSGYKESPRSLAYVPWIEVSESVIVNTRTWSLERNPLYHVPLTKIQNVSRSEYTERFSDTLGFLMCPRGCGRRRTISACFSMLNSAAHDSETFLSTRAKSHTGSTYLSLSTCLIVCKDEAIEKWKEELESFVDVLVLRTPFDLENVTKERIVGTTLLLSKNLLLNKEALSMTSNEIISEISGSAVMLQFPSKLSDDRIKRMYVGDIVERFGQSIIPLHWIHFRCVLYDDTAVSDDAFIPTFSADWTWISHVTDNQMGFLPPQTLLKYANQFWPPFDRNRDFLFKWRLLHGEGCVIPFVFPKAILHKVILKTQKLQISRQENLFLSVVKNLAEQQLAGKVPFQGILKNSDYLPILLGCDAFDAKGCSLDLALTRKQPCINLNPKGIESNLNLHFAPPSSGTTFAQKLMGCNRLKLTAATSVDSSDRGGSKFVLESLQKSIASEAVCGVCYCDPVEVFCLCGHGYCKTCTEIFSRANTLIINCPTCRLPLCPFDWISFSPPSSALMPSELLNFSAFGGSYQATSANYKTLSRISAISTELNLMFKTRSKHFSTASAGIIVAPEKSLDILRTHLMLNSDTRQYTFEIGFPDSCPNKIIMNPEDEDDSPSPYQTPPSTPRSLNKLVSNLSTTSQLKKRSPRIFIVSFEALMSVNVTKINFLITGLLFVTPPPAKFAQCYLNATRLATANANRVSSNKNNNLNLVVLYTSEFEEDDMIIGRKVLKREEAEPKPRSHSNSFSGPAGGGDKSPRR
jgi:hypothetical protein